MSGGLANAYQAYVDDVYGYLAYRHGSRAVAEEVTRATFERAFRDGAGVLRDPRGPRAALLALAREAGPAAASVPGADDAAIPLDLATVLARLDRRERAVLALRFGAGLRGREIAAVLDLSERRVRQLLSRGLRRVRTELERESDGHEQEDDAEDDGDERL